MFEILACLLVFIGVKMIEWAFKIMGFAIKACWYMVTFPFQLIKLAAKPSNSINKPRKVVPDQEEDDLDWIDELEMYDCIFDDED